MEPKQPEDDIRHLRRALRLADEHMRAGHGGPFGAVVVRNGVVLGEGWNQVTTAGDPTAHAEVVAIRGACRACGDHRLTGAVLYASCEPCPMCLAAAWWARIGRIVFAGSRADAAAAGFDDAEIYAEIGRDLGARHLPVSHLLPDEGAAVVRSGLGFVGRVPY